MSERYGIYCSVFYTKSQTFFSYLPPLLCQLMYPYAPFEGSSIRKTGKNWNTDLNMYNISYKDNWGSKNKIREI